VPIGFYWSVAQFVICTATDALKVRALETNHKVALTIDTDAFPPHVLLVRGTASVRIVDGIPAEYLKASKKYVGASSGRHLRRRFGRRTSRWRASRSYRSGRRF